MYSISLTIAGKKYESKGDTPLAALRSLPNPGKVMNKGVLVVERDGRKNEQYLVPVKIKQLFYTSPALLEVKAKQIAMGL